MIRRFLLLFGVLLAAILGFYFLWYEKDYETLFMQEVSSDRISHVLKELSEKPHRAGTQAHRVVGERIIARLRQAGLSPTIAEYAVDLHEPLEVGLMLTAPSQLQFNLGEKVLREDPFSAAADNDISYFAYSPDTDIEAEVVFVNFGEVKDYELLLQYGVSIAGKIGLARAQGICRSRKVEIAENYGLTGLLLYPEPRDEGFKKPAYPAGTHLHPSASQRGSLLKYYLDPGKISPQTLPQIPAIPISQETATEILKNIHGVAVPKDWRGALSVPYNIGASPARVRLRFRGEMKSAIAQNIFAEIQGADSSQPSIMVGCHYDAWVYGATDPLSATAVVLETIEVLSKLVERGWKPQRTIRFAFWDAEEFGMFGSSHWIGQRADQLAASTALYVNLDSAVRSRDFIGYALPGLHASLDEALKQVKDPLTAKPLADVRGEFELPGFSSDAAPFIALTGTPTVDIGFGRSYSLYHTLYDDYHYYSQLADSGFQYTATLAKILGVLLIQSSGPVLPFRFTEIGDYTAKQFAKLRTEQTEEYFALSNAIDSFQKLADQLDRNVAEKKSSFTPETSAELSRLMLQAYQALTRKKDALPYGERNPFVGPSDVSGCGPEEWPLLQRALRAGEKERIRRELVTLEQSLTASGQFLQKAIMLLKTSD